MHIRQASGPDQPSMWAIFREVAESGNTIPTCTSSNEAAMREEWFDAQTIASFRPAVQIGTPRFFKAQCTDAFIDRSRHELCP